MVRKGCHLEACTLLGLSDWETRDSGSLHYIRSINVINVLCGMPRLRDINAKSHITHLSSKVLSHNHISKDSHLQALPTKTHHELWRLHRGMWGAPHSQSKGEGGGGAPLSSSSAPSCSRRRGTCLGCLKSGPSWLLGGCTERALTCRGHACKQERCLTIIKAPVLLQRVNGPAGTRGDERTHLLGWN
jgi:hypothetical protein